MFTLFILYACVARALRHALLISHVLDRPAGTGIDQERSRAAMSEDCERRFEFRKQLFKLSNRLTNSDVKKLKFLCSALLPRRNLETINTGFELFTALEGIEELSPDKLDTLEQLLKALKRGHLLRPLKEALPPRPGNAAPPLSDVTSGPVPSIKFNQFLITVGEDLPKRDLDNVIYFFRNSGLPAQVLENLQEPCELFDLLKQERIISQADLSQLRAILRDIGRLDICAKIDQYMQSIPSVIGGGDESQSHFETYPDPEVQPPSGEPFQVVGIVEADGVASDSSSDLPIPTGPVSGGAHEIAQSLLSPIPQVTTLTDERAQEIIDRALESGSVQVRKVVAVVTGLMGSGKTWLLSRLFHQPPPNLYTSTGIAEQSLRGLLHHIGNMSAGAWKLLSRKDIREFLAPLFLAGMTEANVASLAADLMGMDTDTLQSSPFALCSPLSSSDTATSHFLPLSPLSSSETPSEAAISSHPKSYMLPKVSPTYQAMVRLVKETTSSQNQLILELVHMIDTGGQPESIEIMPCLIHNANLAVLVLNLMYGLDEHPPINFHESGTAYQRQMLSQHTNRQIIQKLASTLRSKRFSCKIFRILVVATHRDCVEGDLAARVDALNRELSTLLLPACQDELILYFSSGQIPFVLNLKEPDEDDNRTLECLRTKFSECGVVVNVPGSFFMYEQDLVKYAGDMQRDILSIDECLQVGDRLKMDGEVVMAALVFFHRQNTFLYFRHVLPNVVFINPQVPLNVANAIVRFSYKVNEKGLLGVPAKFISLLKRGVVTEEMLSRSELFSCFVPGLYEPRHAIELLCHTFTLTPLSYELQQNRTSPQQPTTLPQGTGEREYLMMCLLPTIPDHDLPHYIPSSSDIEPLVVKFSGDCVPLSCFSRTISCLLSTFNWRISRAESGSPECLAHNIVSLYDPTLPAAHVVLRDLSHHLEIHIDAGKDAANIPNICFQVQKTVFAAINEVFDNMQLSIEVTSACFCTCQTIPTHLATIDKYKSKNFLRCSQSTKYVSSAQWKHNVWLETPETEADKPYLQDLVKLKIHYRVGSKYRDFGTLLLNDQTGCLVDNLEMGCFYKPERIVLHILQEWVNGRGKAVSWHSLIGTLKECELNVLAGEIAAARNITLDHTRTGTTESLQGQLPAEVQPDGPLTTNTGISPLPEHSESEDQDPPMGLFVHVNFSYVTLLGIILALILALVFAAVVNDHSL